MIGQAIPQQSFEIIRDRIGEILSAEIENQNDNGYIADVEWGSQSYVWRERFIRVDTSEVPAVTVSVARVDFQSQHQGQSDSIVRFNIDCYSNAKTSDADGDGDEKALLKLSRLLGVCRYILEDPIYKTFGFAAPYIMNRHVESINIGVKEGDAMSVVFGRIVLAVRVADSHTLITPTTLADYRTTVKLDLGNFGYFWTGINY